jgi:hypothetical protein
VLEQTFGFMSGIGVALALGYLATRAPRAVEAPLVRRWAEPLAILFVVLVVSYLNIVKNLEAVWYPHGTVARELSGYSTNAWFNLAYAALALAVAIPLLVHWRGRELAVVPASRLGKGQLLFIVYLWWIVIGNLARTVPFADQRLITEGVIHVNACLCTLLAILLPSRERVAGEVVEGNFLALIKRFAASAALVAIIVIVSEFGVVRALWGDAHAGYSNLHVRFGPDATIDKR